MKETRGAATGTKDTKSATIISQKLASAANTQASQSQATAPADKPKASKPKKEQTWSLPKEPSKKRSTADTTSHQPTAATSTLVPQHQSSEVIDENAKTGKQASSKQQSEKRTTNGTKVEKKGPAEPSEVSSATLKG